MSERLRHILNAPSQRFFKTSDNSLQQHLLFLFTELKEKAEAADDFTEGIWYADAACLVLEVMIRYEANRPRTKEFEEAKPAMERYGADDVMG